LKPAILLVDVLPRTRKNLRSVLVTKGATWKVAANGESAVFQMCLQTQPIFSHSCRDTCWKWALRNFAADKERILSNQFTPCVLVKAFSEVGTSTAHAEAGAIGSMGRHPSLWDVFRQ